VQPSRGRVAVAHVVHSCSVIHEHAGRAASTQSTQPPRRSTSMVTVAGCRAIPVLRNTRRAARTRRVRQGTPVDLASRRADRHVLRRFSWPQWRRDGRQAARSSSAASTSSRAAASVWRGSPRRPLAHVVRARSGAAFQGGPCVSVSARVVWECSATISVTVRRYEPRRFLDWEGGAAVCAYHAWLLRPAAGARWYAPRNRARPAAVGAAGTCAARSTRTRTGSRPRARRRERGPPPQGRAV
jgi:hypothetical protein